MASAILSAFPRPPTHIPTTPLPQTPGATSGSRPPTPSGRRTPGGAAAGEKGFGAQLGASPFSSTGDLDTAAAASAAAVRREKRRSRGMSAGARSNASGNGHDRSSGGGGGGMEEAMAMPRMSVESTLVFAEVRSRGEPSPMESTFSLGATSRTSAASNGGDSRRVSHYENLRRSLYGDPLSNGGAAAGGGGGGGGSSRGSHYSTGTGEGAVSTSGSSSLGGLGVTTPGSAFSSRPGSFIGPGTPPLNVPLSASARLAALRAKRAGLGALTLNGSTSTPSTPTGHHNMALGWVGPPPTTPLPPIPTGANSDVDNKGKKAGNRRSVNLASPVMSSFPFPLKGDRDRGDGATDVQTPTTATHNGGFHRSSPSGATFGHGIGGGHTMQLHDHHRGGDHSRGSSFGSTMDGAASSVFRSTAALRLGMNMGNSSVSTFGGAKNASTSSFGDDESTAGGGGRYGHSASYSTSTTTSTVAPGGGYRSPRESFGPGLAAIAALSRGELTLGNLGNGSPNSQYSDPNSNSPSGKSGYSNYANATTNATHNNNHNHTQLPAIHAFSQEDDGAPIDVQKELEALRREKADRRVSTASMMSNFSTRTTNTFRGAASRVMDVSPDEVKDDEAAELAGERLLGSVGDGLEGLAAFGKRRGLGLTGRGLGTASATSSRPGSSKGPAGLGSSKGTPPGSAISPEPSLRLDSLRLHSPAFQSSGIGSPAATGSSTPSTYSPEDQEDADQTITISRGGGGSQYHNRPQYGRQESDNDTMETFESGVVGSGSTFNTRISAEMDSRMSNASTISSQQHLMMKGSSSSRDVPAFRVEEMSESSGRTPLAFNKVPLPEDEHTSSRNQYHPRTHGSSHDRNGNGVDDSRLVNIAVWNDAPITPLRDDFHPSSFKHGGNSSDNEDGAHAPGAGFGGRHVAPDQFRQISATPSTLDVMGTPRQARSPSPSNTSISHTTITPFSRGGGGSTSISSGKPSLDIDRPDSAMSAASSRRRFAPPPALSLSRATPLSSQASLVMPEDEDDILASPSAGRDRVNHVNREGGRDGAPAPTLATSTRKAHRASEDFAIKMEKEMAAGGMRGEFALLQEVTIREKRLKLALFGRGVPSSLTKPGSRRPQSMVTIDKSLPDSPESYDGRRADGASSPEIGDMIKRSRRSLNGKAMRRRRSTGALAGYGNQWRRSEVDLALGVTPKRTDGQGSNRRRAMELDRSGVNVRDSVVLDLPPENDHLDQELEQDLSADSDSSLDLHTPLPRLMLRAGLLSPHSKILRPPTPEQDSRVSWVASKNGLKVPHDKRNTDKRKRRHRDGKLLREGVGLTTGLGWSDSEDEDAPSPLTRRLSSMTLTSSISRKASMASSINSFATTSMTSLNLSRSPSMPTIPAGATPSKVSKRSSGSGSDTTSRHSGPPSKAMVITGRSPYGRPPEPSPRPALKSSATMSIIEHAQMLPTASLFTSKNHPLASSTRRGTFNFSIANRRSSSPAGNSSQSSNGGVVLPVTPDADLPPALSNSGGSGMLKDVNTPEDVQGVSGGTSMGINSTGYSGPGTGLAGLSVSRGRSWTNPPSPTPPGAAVLVGGDEPTPARPRPAEVRYSGGNFSYPTNMRPTGPSNLSASSTTITPAVLAVVTPATPQLKKSEGLRKPTPRGLQPLTLPTVVHAGGRLSPRAGTFALPSAPSLNQANSTTPKRTNLPLPGMSISKSSGNIASPATPLPSAFARGRSGSTGSTGTPASFAPSKVSSRMPQPSRSRTLSGGGGTPAASPAPPLPQTQTSAPAASVTFSPLPTPSAGRKAVGALKSFVGSRSVSEGASAVPKMLGIARTASAPGSPPTRIGGANNGKTGSGMTYRKSAGSAIEAATTTPPRSRIALPPPTSGSRLVAPSSFTLGRNASTTSLTPSVVGVAL